MVRLVVCALASFDASSKASGRDLRVAESSALHTTETTLQNVAEHMLLVPLAQASCLDRPVEAS